MTRAIEGQFIWHECMTSDPNVAKAFYAEIIPWTTEVWDQDGSYTIWKGAHGPVGGCLEMPAKVAAAGAAPHWLSYIGTADVDASVRRVVELGGQVLKTPWDIPSVGRVAVLQDPQHATFCVYAPSGDAPGHDGGPVPGDFSWHELATTDPQSAVSFYEAVFEWKKLSEFDMGPAGTYHMFGLGDATLGGIYQKPKEFPMPNWLPYAMVASTDTAAKAIAANGGTVRHGPMEVPGGDRVAVAADPLGAFFAVHSKPAAH